MPGPVSGMRCGWVIAVVVLAAGCNMPGPRFLGVPPVRITVGQSTFDVRVSGTRAQAIRLNREWALRPETVAPRATVAIQKVSGCRVRRLDGDQVVIDAYLDCGGPLEPLPFTLEYRCDLDEITEGYTDVTCEPVE